MPTIEETLAYLGIDEVDSMVKMNVERALASAKRTLEGEFGEDVFTLLPDDARVKDLALIYADESYSKRGIGEASGAKSAAAMRRLVADMELQIRMELRQLREEGAS